MGYLSADPETNTEFLARKVLVNVAAGGDVSGWVSALLANQFADGGFGDAPGHGTTVFDTAQALQALVAVNYSTGTVVPAALGYLLDRQQANGGWKDGENETSVFLTAQAIRALTPYRTAYVGVAGAITNAQNYLLSQRNAAGLWSAHFETAFALTALIPVADFALLTTSVDALQAAQLSNGSWVDDSYTTALALQALWLASHRAPSAGFAAIEGQAVDALTLYPLSGVTVTLGGPATRTSTTGADGRFRFQDLPVGTYTVTLTLSGYGSLTTTTNATSVQVINLGALALTKSADATTGTVRGTVKDAATGLALAGVSISATGVAQPAVTDSAGNYQITNVPPGQVSLVASRNGYSEASGSATLSAGGTLLFSPALSPLPAATTAIQGKVTAAASNQPLAGVTIRVNGIAQATTDALGNFRIENITPGIVTLSAELNGYDTITAAGEFALNTTIVFSPKLYAANTTPPGTNTATVQGIVREANTNAPLGGVTVSVSSGGSAVTAADGSYQITSVPAGQTTLTASKSGYGQVSGSADIVARATVTFSPILTPAAAPTTALQGQVTAAATNQPLAGVLMRINGIAQASTDAQGNYRIDNLTPGTITVSAELSGYDTVTAVGEVAANTVTTFSPKLYATGTTPPGANSAGVQGIVLDAATNAPLAGVTINADFGGGTQSLTTGADGTFSLSGLNATTGTLTFNLTDYATQEYSLTLAPLSVLDMGQVRLRKADVIAFLPDLIVQALDATQVTHSSDTLAVSGTLSVTVANQGTAATSGSAQVTAFYDANRNNQYDLSLDILLGQAELTQTLEVNASAALSIPVAGQLPFRDAPILVFVDSAQTVVEGNETNNVATTAAVCEVKPPVGNPNPVLKWHWKSSSTLPTHIDVSVPPLVAQTNDDNGDGRVDQDDVPDVIFVAFNNMDADVYGVLRIVSGKDGSEILTVNDPANRLHWYATPAVADIDGDGLIEIVVSRLQSGLVAYEHDGKLKWVNTTVGGLPSIADLDGDGQPEIVVGKAVLSGDGAVRWVGSGSASAEAGIASVADIDLSGKPNVIVGASVYDSDGTLMWDNPALGNRHGFTAVGNFNADPFAEIVLVSGGKVYLLNRAGGIIWGPVLIPGGGNGGPPVVADMDGDGVPEIGVAGANRYVVLKADGSVLWTSVTQDATSNTTGSSVFDFDGDGTAEVVYADELKFRIYKGATGEKLVELPHSSGTGNEYPVIADIDNDGHADLLVASNRFFGSKVVNGVRSFQGQNNSWVGTRSIWNQHAYHINNINDDGTVPPVEVNSWQTHNTYRLNAFPDRSATATPDLTAGQLRFIPNGPSGQPSLSVVVGNAGAAPSPTDVHVAFYEGNPTSGGKLLGEVTLGVLAAGSYQSVQLNNVTSLAGNITLYAVVDSTNRATECREDNNSVSIPGPQLHPDLIVASINTSSATTDPQTLAVTGSLTVEVKNQGTLGAESGVEVLAFYDLNGDGAYQSGIDSALGTGTLSSAVAVGATQSVGFPIGGVSPFRDAPILVWVDSAQTVAESREDNNLGISSSACEVKPPLGTLQPVVKWAWTSTANNPQSVHVESGILVVPTHDDNGDGIVDQQDTPGIAFISYGLSDFEGVLRVLDGKTGSERLSVRTPSGVKLSGWPGFAAADIDRDGKIEFLVPTMGGQVAAISNTGQLKWVSQIPSSPYASQPYGGGPTVADLDADGTPEVLFGKHVLRADGTLLWAGTGSYLGAKTGMNAVAADLDLDGKPEVVVGASAYSGQGQLLWQNASVGNGYVAVGNFNADPNPEIVVVTDGYVHLLSHGGQRIWGPVSISGGGRGGAPVIADMDGDGIPEIGLAGATRYVALRANGSVLWTATTKDASSSQTGSTVFDFDGNGRAEVVYADEINLHVYDGRNGSELYRLPHSSATAGEYPVVADVDSDGHADLIVASSKYFGGAYNGIRVFQDANNSWVNTRKIWNQYAYHINNIDDDGTVPPVEVNSWQTHNTYRLNTFPDRSPTSAPDLTASLLRLMDQGAGQGIHLSLRIGNGGAAPVSSAEIAFYDGNPTSGSILLGTITVTNVPAGSYKDIIFNTTVLPSGANDVYAVVDSNNAIAECREDNNITHVVPVTNILGAIGVATDANVYAPNSPALLQGTVTNTGSLAAAFSAELRVEDLNGVVVQSFPPQPVATLSGGASSAITNNWNTGTTLAGTYRLHGFLRDAQGGLIAEGVSTFQLRHGDATAPVVSLRVTTDRPVYHNTDKVDLASLVRNLTSNTIVDGAKLLLTVTAPSGAIVYTNEGLLQQLLPSALLDLLNPFSFTNTELGVYQVTGKVLDSAGTVMATDHAQYEVRLDLNKALQGKVTAALATLEAGQEQSCTNTLTNAGSLPIGALEAHYAVVNLDTGTLATEQTATLDLAAGVSNTFLHTFATAGFTAGNYACALQVRIEEELKTLAYVPFVVTVPPIKIDAELNTGTKGRVLILLDPAQSCGTNCTDDTDPHGPNTAPGLMNQRLFLEALLKNNGWSYAIVESAEAFTFELRSGNYNLYALFNEQEKLAEQAQKELREAIFRGEGLLVAGAHDHRELHTNKLLDTLGIDATGNDPKASEIEFTPSALNLTGKLALLAGDHILRIEPQSAQSAARYTNPSNGNHTPEAVTLNSYGTGKAAFAAFDLVALATLEGDQGQAAKLLLSALAWATPGETTNLTGTVTAIDLTLTNQGIATTAIATVTLPAGLTVLDANGGTLTGNTLAFTTPLAVEEVKTLTFWVKLPSTAGSITVNATVTADKHPDPLATQNLTLTVSTRDITSVQATLDGLIAANHQNTKELKQAKQSLERVVTAATPTQAVSEALKATDALLGISDPDIVALRQAIDQWLRIVSQQL